MTDPLLPPGAPPIEVPPTIPLFRRTLRRLEIDRTVMFGLMARFWTLAAAPITALLIATRFTPEIQGYYYTFASLLALQVFFELGLGTVIVQFVSHEWSNLSLDSERRIVGDPDALSRLATIGRLAIRWYLIAGPIAAAALIVAGYYFFRNAAGSAVIAWKPPWTALCVLTGLNLIVAPIWFVLEGANQVRTVYGYRLLEGVVTSTALWIGLLVGAGLWTTVISGFATLLLGIVFLRVRYWAFVRALFSVPIGDTTISWRGDMLPMQWRVAISWLCGYFAFWIFTPVLFKYQGPVVAGQMGMTANLVSLISLIPSMWLAPRVPQFGMLIAQRNFAELDRIFWKLTKIMVGLAIPLGISAWLVVVLLYHYNIPLAHRILPPLPTAIFIAAQIILVLSLPVSAYLRAHKKEPLMLLNVAIAAVIATCTLILGRPFGAVGVAAGYFSTIAVAVPVMFFFWVRLRTRWHALQPVQFATERHSQ